MRCENLRSTPNLLQIQIIGTGTVNLLDEAFDVLKDTEGIKIVYDPGYVLALMWVYTNSLPKVSLLLMTRRKELRWTTMWRYRSIRKMRNGVARRMERRAYILKKCPKRGS